MVSRLPLISVIIPVYNVDSYLDECLSSVVNQTYSNLQIILINDGATDRCPQMCDEWATKDPRIEVIHQENKGLSAARNIGLRHAKADYIVFLDSDDYLRTNMISRLFEIMQEHDADISICRYEFLENGVFHNKQKRIGNQVLELTPEETAQVMLMGKLFNHTAWGRIYQREVLGIDPFPEGHNYEDLAAAYKFVRNSKKICYIDENLQVYRVRGGSITHETDLTAFQDRYWATLEHFHGYLESFPILESEIKRSIIQRLFTLCYDLRMYLRDTSSEEGENLYKEMYASLLTYRKDATVNKNIKIWFFLHPQLGYPLKCAKNILRKINRKVKRRI